MAILKGNWVIKNAKNIFDGFFITSILISPRFPIEEERWRQQDIPS